MYAWFRTNFQRWSTLRAVHEPACMQTLSRRNLSVQYSKLRDVDSSVYRACRLMRTLQRAGAASQLGPFMCLEKFSNCVLVNATLQSADWVEACTEVRGCELVRFASYWAASLHIVMARRAHDDAEQVVWLRKDLPKLSSVLMYVPSMLDKERDAFSACQVKFQSASDADLLSEEWMKEFVIESVTAAGVCDRMAWSMLNKAIGSRYHVRYSDFMPVPETCRKLRAELATYMQT